MRQEREPDKEANQMKWTRLKRMPSAWLSETSSLEPSNYRMSASLVAALLEVPVVESRRVLSVRGGNPEINIIPRCFWLSKRASPSSRPALQKIAALVLARSSSRNQRRVREGPKIQRRFILRIPSNNPATNLQAVARTSFSIYYTARHWLADLDLKAKRGEFFPSDKIDIAIADGGMDVSNFVRLIARLIWDETGEANRRRDALARESLASSRECKNVRGKNCSCLEDEYDNVFSRLLAFVDRFSGWRGSTMP